MNSPNTKKLSKNCAADVDADFDSTRIFALSHIQPVLLSHQAKLEVAELSRSPDARVYSNAEFLKVGS